MTELREDFGPREGPPVLEGPRRRVDQAVRAVKADPPAHGCGSVLNVENTRVRSCGDHFHAAVVLECTECRTGFEAFLCMDPDPHLHRTHALPSYGWSGDAFRGEVP